MLGYDSYVRIETFHGRSEAWHSSIEQHIIIFYQ